MTTVVLAMAMAALTSRNVPPNGVQIAHIRTAVPRIQTALRDGYRGSSTFRTLVDRLRGTGAVVYIDAGRCRPQARLPLEGCAMPLASTAAVRYVRVLVDTGGGGDRLVALIGHELQHAVEITAASHAGDEREVAPSIEETTSARTCAADILKELRSERTLRPRPR